MNSYEMQSSMAAGYTPDEMRTGERTAAAKLKWVAKLVRHLELLP
jgi:hypothetical protein